MNTTAADFDPIPSTRHRVAITVASAEQADKEADAIAVPVAAGAEPPAAFDSGAAGLASAGFTGEPGGRSRWTRKPWNRRARRTTATVPWPRSCRVSAAWRATRAKRSTSTPGKAV